MDVCFCHRRNRLLDALLAGPVAVIADLAAVVFRAESAVQMSGITQCEVRLHQYLDPKL
jgi:hypothetical protein